MAPVKPRNYEFDASSIAVLRTRLKMKQVAMAELLGVPANTLSRWETGATKPDADSLAAIHSIALENGAAVNFFKKATSTQTASKKERNAETASKSLPVTKGISRMGAFLDFQNVGITEQDFAKFNKSLRKKLVDRFPNSKRSRFRAFVDSGKNSKMFDANQWNVNKGSGNRDKDIMKAVRDYCQSNAKGTAVVLLTKDGDFASLIKEIQGKGAQVYLMAPSGASKKLLDVVDKQHRIPWPA